LCLAADSMSWLTLSLYCELFLLNQGLLWCNYLFMLTCQVNHRMYYFCFDRHEVGFQENTHKEDINHGGNVIYLKRKVKKVILQGILQLCVFIPLILLKQNS